MPVVDKDYIVRVIKQIGDLFARLLKLLENREYDKALQVLQAGCPPLLGLDYGPLSFADASSAARLLGEREKVKIFAQLVTKEAEILELKGDRAAADKRRFALELWAEALQRGAMVDAAQGELIRKLEAAVGDAQLSEAYRAALAKRGH